MGSPFKMNPKTPLMKALIGKQKNLPEQLKQAILDAPAKSYGKSPVKKESGSKEPTGKTLSQIKKGEYTNIRDYTPEELTAQVKKTGKSSSQIKREVRNYREQTKKARSEAKNVTPNSGTQMGEILAAGGARGEKGIAEEAKRRSAGKSPAKMTGGKNKTKQAKRFTDSGIGPKAKIEEGYNKTPKLKQTKEERSKNYRTGVKSPAKMKGVKGLKK